MLRVAVVLSIVLGFAESEFLGILSGGLVSAGYLAYYFATPLRVVSTLMLSVAVCLCVRALGHCIILYGRRRFVLTVLLSILFSQILESLLVYTASIGQDLRIIGYLVPGLIANDMEKQGIFRTLLMVVLTTGLIWLVLCLWRS